jgi:hypothetical protein
MSDKTRRWELLDPDGGHLRYVSRREGLTRLEGDHAERVDKSGEPTDLRPPGASGSSAGRRLGYPPAEYSTRLPH